MTPLLDLDARPVIAHRGASAEALESTLPAFAAAVQRGADAFELDVRLTADGAPVVIHDDTLDRTTDRSGLVRSHTLAELRGRQGRRSRRSTGWRSWGAGFLVAAFLGRRAPAVRYRLLSVPERHRGLIVPTRRFVAAARALGCPVHVLTVDRPVAARRLWGCGVAGIVTNVPRVILEAPEK